MTRYGPVQYADTARPDVDRAAADHELHRVRAGLRRPRAVGDRPRRRPADERVATSRTPARAFFLNGGKRLYVSRVFVPSDARRRRRLGVAPARPPLRRRRRGHWRARWPGRLRQRAAHRAARCARATARTSTSTFGVQAERSRTGAVVEITARGAAARRRRPTSTLGARVVPSIRRSDAAGRRADVPSTLAGRRAPIAAGPIVKEVVLQVRGQCRRRAPRRLRRPGDAPRPAALDRQDPPGRRPRGRERDRLPRHPAPTTRRHRRLSGPST